MDAVSSPQEYDGAPLHLFRVSDGVAVHLVSAADELAALLLSHMVDDWDGDIDWSKTGSDRFTGVTFKPEANMSVTRVNDAETMTIFDPSCGLEGSKLTYTALEWAAEGPGVVASTEW